MYWLSMPPLFGLIVPWWPCGPIPITPAPNSSIAWSITPPALTSRAVGISRNPNARSRNERAALTSSYGTWGTIVGPRLGWTSCRVAGLSTALPRSGGAGSQGAARVGHAREEQAGIKRCGARPPVRRLASRCHPGARAQPPSLAAPVLQQQVRADPVQPRERARARRVERLAPLERDPEQLADQ